MTQLKPGNIILFMATVVLCACTTNVAEEIDIAVVLPEGAVAEITNAYPEFGARLVSSSETGVAFDDRYLEIAGIDDPERRDRLAEYVLSYLNDPELKASQARRRAEYEAMSPGDKLADLVGRIKERHPDFSYEWVGLDEGNVSVTLGDNGLRLDGIDDEGARQEWGYAIRQVQELIDAETTGEQQ